MEKLSDLDLELIFTTKIYPELIVDKNIHPTKEAVIIGGQPGSGKSSTVSLFLEKKSDFVFINGDDFREFLPGYFELMKTDPDNAADMSQYAVNVWVERAIKQCATDGFSIIVEGTMRVPETSLKTAQLLKGFGYAITFALVSTPYELSRKSIQARYDEAVLMHGVGRSTKVRSHDEAFVGIKKTILTLFNAKIANKFVVINRLENSDLNLSEFDPHCEGEILNQFNKDRGDIPGVESSQEIDHHSK